MSDTYQAIYDAVRSKISGGNIGGAVSEAACRAFDISNVVVRAQEQVYVVADEMRRPSVLFRPEVSLDGDKYCVLYGRDLMEGCAGFGDTLDQAMRDFDENWIKQKARALLPGGSDD